MNLRKKILLTTIPVNIIAITCIYFIVKTNAYNTVERLTNNDTHALLKSAMLSIENQYNSLEYHREYVTELRKKERKQIVGMANSLVSQYYDDYKNGRLTEQEAKRQAIRKLNDFRYDNGNGYIWINNTEKPVPRMINHPFYPEYNGLVTEGPMFFTTTDSVNIFLLATQICEQHGGGFIEYTWTKPNQITDSLPKPKTSYVELFEPWQWIIGTGVYLEDIEADVDQKLNAILDGLKQTMGNMKLGQTGYFFIFNSDNTLLLHPLLDENTPDSVTDLITKNAPFEGFIAAERSTTKSYEYLWYDPSGYIYSKSHRKKVFVEYFEPLDWYVCASFYYDELARPGILLGRKILYISTVFILISFIIILYLSNSLIKPLNELMAFVAKIPGNILNVEPANVPAFRSYEANALGKVVTEMLISTKEQHSNLVKETARSVESEAVLRSTLESINDALLIVGDDGHISHYNQSFVKLFAIPEDILLTNNDEVLISYAKEQISDPESFAKKVGEIYQKGTPERDIVSFKDGRIIDRQFYPLIEESPVKGGVWIFRDITEQRKNEEIIRRNEEKYRMLFENMTSSFALHKMIYNDRGEVIDYSFEEVNPFFEKFINMPAASLIGKTAKELFPRTEEYWIRSFNYVANNDNPIHEIFYSIEIDKYLDVRIYKTKKDHCAVILIDVTERIKNEEELKKLSSLNQAIIDATSNGLIYIKDRKIEWVNRALLNMLGYEYDELIGQDARILYGDKAMYQTVGEEAYPILANGEIYNIEFQSKKKNGEVFWCLLTSKASDPNDLSKGSLWTITDIDKRKQNEINLKKFKASIEHSQDGVFWINENGGFDYVNQQACKMLGYTQEELLKISVFDIDPFIEKDIIKKRWAEFSKHKNKTFLSTENIHKKKDGSLLPVEISRTLFSFENEKLYVAYSRDITERKQYLDFLHKFKASIDYALDGVYWINKNAGFNYVNEQACKMLGYTRDELLQLNISDIDPYSNYEDFDKIWTSLHKNRHFEHFTVESAHRRKDGSIFPIELSTVFIWKDNKGLMIAYAKDISERKDYEASLVKNQKMLTESQRVAKIGSWEYYIEKDELIWNEQVYEIYGVDKLKHPNFQAFMDFVHPSDREEVAWKYQKSLKEDKNFEIDYRIIRPDKSLHYLKAFGNVEYNEDSKPYRTYGIVQDITEQKKNEENLRLFKKSIDKTNDGVFWINKDAAFEYVNDRACEYLGYTRKELLQMTVMDINPEDSDQKWNNTWEQTKSNQETNNTITFETVHQRKDGSILPVEVLTNYFCFGKKEFMIAYTRDITERKQYEEKLKLFKFSIDNTNDEVYWFNKHGGFDYVNNSVSENLGYPRDELMKLTLFDIDPYFPKQKWIESWEDIQSKKAESPISYNLETIHKRKDGSLYPVEVSTTHFWIGEKEYHISYVRDITERKQYEKKIVEKQKLLNEAERIAQMGSWELNLKNNTLYWSDSLYKLYGVDKNKTQPSVELLKQLIFPADKEYVLNQMEDGLNKGYVSNDMFRIVRPDGKVRKFAVSSEVVKDEKGENLKEIGVVQDITEKENTINALKASEQKLQSLFNVTPSGIGIVKDRVFIDVNPQFCTLTGYSKEELVGTKSMKLYTSEEEYLKVGKELYGQISKQGTSKIETQWIRKDGKTIFVYVFLSAIDRDDPSKGNTFAIFDITEKKQYEDALVESEEKARLFVENTPLPIAMFDTDMTYIVVSRQWYTTYNVGDSDIIGKSHYKVFPETTDRWKDLHQRAVKGEIIKNDKDKFIRRDGSVQWVRYELHPWYKSDSTIGGIVAFTEDITEKVEAAEALKDSEQKRQRFFDVAPVGLGILKERIVADLNPHVCEMTGYTPEELIGHDTRIAYPTNEEYERVGKLLYIDVKEKGISQLETTWKRKDGKLINVYLAITLIDPEDKAKGVIFTVMDITERKNYEQALEKRVLALTRPLDDIRDIEFTDLFNIPQLQQLQDAFAKATGVASIITLPDGKPITKPSNFCRLCSLVRSTEKGLQKCIKSDAKIGGFNPEGPMMTTCFSDGLWDAGASITLGGVHIANWLIGQVRNKDIKEHEVIAYADEIGVDREEFSRAFNEVTTMGKEQFKAVTEALYLLSNEISLKTYQNVQQARFIAGQKKAEEELLKNQKLLLESQRIAKIGSWELDLKTNKLFWNKEAFQIFGYEYLSINPTLDNFNNLVHPEDREIAEVQFLGTKSTKQFQQFECRIITPGGIKKHIVVAGDIILDKNKALKQLYGIVQDITEQKKYEEQILQAKERAEESELKMQRIYEFAPTAIGLLRDRIILDINSQVTNLTWYSKEELIGKTTEVLLPSTKEYEKIGKIMYKELAEDGFSMYESKWKRKDGKFINVYLAITYLDPEEPSKGVLFSGLDITKQKAAERELIKAKEIAEESGYFLQESQRSGNIGSYKLNFITNQWQTTETMDKILGITKKYNKDFNEWINLIHPDERESISKYFQEEVINKKQSFNKEYRIVKYGTNEIIWVHGIGKLYFDKKGDVKEMLGTIQDITERKLIEEERRMMNIELERRVKERTLQLQQANKDLEAFAYSVSHDLRAPIRHIDGFMHLLDSKLNTTDTKVKGYIDKVFLSSKNMSTMIDELLQFSRLGRTDLKSRQVNLTEIIKEIVVRLKFDYEKRNVQWVIHELPQLFGDPALLKIAFENLISNAIKYTSKKETAIIEIGVKETNQTEKTCIFIKDNGAGFDMAYKDKLFGVFQRLHDKDEFEGVGIGLANVQQIIKKHNGEIDAEGEINNGATFYITLPKQV